MGDVTLLYFTESNIICIIVLSALLFLTIRGSDWRTAQMYFSRVVIYYIVYCIIDIIWAVTLPFSKKNPFFFLIIYFLAYIVAASATLFWYVYSEAVQGNKKILSKNRITADSLPLFLGLLITSIFSICYIRTDSQKTREHIYLAYYIITTVITMSYVVLACIKSYYRLFKSKTIEAEKTSFIMAINPTILFIALIIQAKLPQIPITGPVIELSLLFLHMSRLDNLVSMDNLTKLNNRNELYNYMEHLKDSDECERWLFIIDVDKFKVINDTYGHLEGDNALVIVAEALKESCKKAPNRYFIARFGGDEFLIIANKKDFTSGETMRENIRLTLESIVAKNKLKYNLSVSVGYSLVDFSKSNLHDSIKNADATLYKEKEEKHKYM